VDIPEVAVCSTTAPMELAPDDLMEGGAWEGAGVDPVTGVFTPSEGLPSGTVTYTAPGGCISSAVLQSELWVQIAPQGVADTLCAGAVFDPEWSTETADWTWAGEPGTAVLADTLEPGTYAVEAVWTGQFCSSDTAFEVIILEPLVATVSVVDDLICAGELAEVSYGAVGGNPAVHAWEVTAPLPWVPDSSMWWVAEVSDGCSAPDADSVWVNAIQAAGLQLSTPDTACFDGQAEVLGWILPEAPWELTWDTTAVVPDDAANDTTWWVLDAAAGGNVPWTLTWPEEGCTGSGVYAVPAYPEVTADVNWPADCVPWDALPVGLALDGGGATDVEWWIREPGTGVVLDQIQGASALWNPALPGEVLVQATASIGGDCAVSTSGTVCVLSPQQWFLADRFSPNDDGLNDALGVRGHPMDAFRMRIFNRWGELVADLNAPQPGWDGQFRGRPAPTGVYVVQLEMTFTDGSTVTTERHVTLVR
jgi:gliding motility-associated-like protein